MQKQSAQLTQFYKDIQDWIDQGCPDENEFDFASFIGICGNVISWATITNNTSALEEFKNQLRTAFPGTIIPFNGVDGTQKYTQEDNKYINHLRLKWIKDHIPQKKKSSVPKPVRSYQSWLGVPNWDKFPSPQIIQVQKSFFIVGSEYGIIHKTNGDYRSWKSYSGAYKFLKSYLKISQC